MNGLGLQASELTKTISSVVRNRGHRRVEYCVSERLRKTHRHHTPVTVLDAARSAVLPIRRRSLVCVWLPQDIHRLVTTATEQGKLVQQDLVEFDWYEAARALQLVSRC
jgi:hypothetical protein